MADVKRKTLQDHILNQIAPGSKVYTDQAVAVVVNVGQSPEAVVLEFEQPVRSVERTRPANDWQGLEDRKHLSKSQRSRAGGETGAKVRPPTFLCASSQHSSRMLDSGRG